MLKKIFSLIALIVSLTPIKMCAMDSGSDSWRRKFESAVTAGDLAKVKELMPQNNLIDSTNQSGETPLWLAGCFDRLEIMLEILKNPHCHDVDRPSAAASTKRRPLHHACTKVTEKKSLQVEVVQELIKKRANVDEPNGYNESPLILAMRVSKNPALVAALVDAGAILEPYNDKAQDPFNLAINNVYIEYIPLLLKSRTLTTPILNNAIDYCKGKIQKPDHLLPGEGGTLYVIKALDQTEMSERAKKHEEILQLLLAKKQNLSTP